MDVGAVGHSAMDVLWEAESGFVEWLQGWGQWPVPPLLAVTELASQNFVIVVLAVVFWSVHAGVGARLFVAVLASAAVNYLFKAVLYGSRPYWYSAQVAGHASESSFGMPSGHAQSSTVLYGYLGVRSGRRLWLWAAVVLVALICFSRIYLGAHFVSDVLVGLLLGGAVLWAVLRWEDRVLAWWRGLSTARWVGYALAAALVPCVAATSWQLLVRADWVVPAADWAGPAPGDPAGYTLTGLYTVAGALLGGITGLTLLYRRGWYSASGPFVVRGVRFVLGICGVAVIQVLDGVLFDGLSGLAESAVTFAVFCATAFWAAYAAPELFVRSGLAKRPDPVQDRR